MNIMVISGSPRREALTRSLAQAVSDYLAGMEGVDVLTFDVGRDTLPLYTDEEAEYSHENVRKLVSYAEKADGFVIATPEYHNGMSGALKNALDFLSGSHFRGKPAMIMAVAGGGKGGINALNNLRLVLRGLYALVLPDQIVADPVHFDSSDRLADEGIRKRLHAMADELVRMTSLLRAAGK